MGGALHIKGKETDVAIRDSTFADNSAVHIVSMQWHTYMDQCMDGWMDGWLVECGRTDGQTDGRTDGQTNGRMDGK